MGENSLPLPKTVTWQRRGCDLNPGPTAPESSTLTTRLPSHRAKSVLKCNAAWLDNYSPLLKSTIREDYCWADWAYFYWHSCSHCGWEVGAYTDKAGVNKSTVCMRLNARWGGSTLGRFHCPIGVINNSNPGCMRQNVRHISALEQFERSQYYK